MALIKTLREQSAIGFDGKIVVQDRNLSQHLGNILLCAGTLVGCSFNGERGKKSLLNLLMQEFSSSSSLEYIVEPEVIGLDLIQFEIDLSELEEDFKSILEQTEKNKKLKPPGNKRVVINSDFVCRGATIEPKEFDVLCLISDFGKIQDIYENSFLYEFEVTNALVSLRKKGALKVLS